jgi:hydroxymethylpyrimidine pyrophosphatase-like HAD family hydrolase
MGVTAPLLCYQGALVREQPADGADTPGPVLFEDPVSPAAAERALEIARAGNWHYQAYQDDLLLCEEDRPEAHLYARIAQVEIHYVDDLAPIVRRGTTKIVCVVDDPDGAARCEAAMREGLDGRALVTRSLPQFVEITNPVASKGRALRRLCEHLGLPLEDTVAVGDAPNDSDMLRVAGFGVAVEGAPDRLLAHARATCAPPTAAGVADVFIALGLVPQKPRA